MGRSKQVPKRRRVEEEHAEDRAIVALQSLPPDTVEEAAATVIRANLETWHRIDINDDSLDSSFAGLGRVNLDESDFRIFRRLHDAIRQRASATMASWSGSISDPRERAFGFLPGTLGYDAEVRSSLDITQPNVSSAMAEVERPRNSKAMVVLHPCKENELFLQEVETAITRLCNALQSYVRPIKHSRYLRFSQLVAAQPNLHNGRHLLPLHVDHPTKDGFGIIIVTIAIHGSASIMLEAVSKGGQGKKTVFSHQQQVVYMLSGQARNSCQHGVLADEESGNRESLNLRFGLHGREGQDPTAWDVLQHWTGDVEKSN